MSRRTRLVSAAAILALALFPRTALAQSAIAGVVKDATGAVLPGVTVDASSAALIEKVKSSTSNEAVQYRIVDLRPGSYTVTFTLAGFTTIVRQGIILEANSTYRLIYTDGRPHQKDLETSFMGDSIGQWEGDTLQQKGGKITGSVKSTRGELPVAGTVEGAFFRVDVKDGDKQYKVGATVDNDEMDGSITLGVGAEHLWFARRAKSR